MNNLWLYAWSCLIPNTFYCPCFILHSSDSWKILQSKLSSVCFKLLHNTLTLQDGYTALDTARELGNTEVCEVLLSHGN